jgi:HlyD family secretion protein
MQIIRRNVRLVIAVIIVAGILIAALRPEAIEVSVARVDRASMQVTLDEDGETRVRDRFVVSAPVAGRLERIELDPGDPVKAHHTVVARITPAAAPLLDSRTQGEFGAAIDVARAAVGQAQAERARATTVLTRARTALARQRELAQAGAISIDALEQAEAEATVADDTLRAADYGIARAEEDVRLARARLQRPEAGRGTVAVTSPVDGVVLRVLRESESVAPAGERLVEIGDALQLEIVADLLSTDAVRVRPGAPVIIEQWGGGQPIAGRVRRVEPSGFVKLSALGVEEHRVNVIVDFDEKAGEVHALGDGYRVEVRIVTWREKDVVKVPVGALFRRGEGWAAFVVEADRARLRPVKIGARNPLEVQIVSGLEPGETVVLHPPDTLTEHAPVRARAE